MNLSVGCGSGGDGKGGDLIVGLGGVYWLIISAEAKERLVNVIVI